MHYLYILKSKITNKYYIGVSENVQRRLEFHNTIEKGFTSRYRPWELVYIQEFKNKSDALKAEKKLKSWKSKVLIEKLINKEIEISL
ncbi:MAG: GIY-YIG nuclease family protein [Ignavibacteria bacterium]|nr:GIY-YIG nuclease family protein [Ignavibacteria bacterium]